MKKQDIAIIVAGIMFIIIIGILLNMGNNPPIIEEVHCYDHHNNIIIGQYCEEIQRTIPQQIGLALVPFGVIVITFLGWNYVIWRNNDY
jgi:hypothetical protein